MTELCVLLVLLIFSIFRAARSKKKISGTILNLLVMVLVSLLGNLILTVSVDRKVCMIGYIIYLLGAEWFLFALIDFSVEFCAIPHSRFPFHRVLGAAAILADSVFICLNPFTKYVFELQRSELGSGAVYYRLSGHWGWNLHIFLSFVLILTAMGIFAGRIRVLASFYYENYLTVTASVLLCCAAALLILMNRPLDRAVVWFGAGGILIYYFSLEHSPIALRYQMYNKVVANLDTAILFYDRAGIPIYANRAAEKMFGITRGNLEKSNELLETLLNVRDFNLMEDFERNRMIVREDGDWRYYNIRYSHLNDHRGCYIGSFFAIHDYTREEQENRKRHFAATHDELTGLYNRSAFIESVEERLAANPDIEYVMILSDINDFKIINDIYGREAADQILRQIADDIRRVVHPETIYCRWGGDQFAAFARKSDISDKWIEQNVLHTLGCEHIVKHPVVVHVGVYEAYGGAVSTSDMADRCLLALSTIKQDFTKVVAFYNDKLRQERAWAQQISLELPEALRSGQIVPYLQPQFDGGGHLTGAEALVRWIHPEEGFLPPSRFIPILEQNGMIAQMDRHIWEMAAQIIERWNREGKTGIHLSVNISLKDFYFLDLYEVFTRLVRRYGLDPGQLHLEITETVVMNDASSNIKVINDLREFGFLVEMDDFGSGYSSLNLLKDMPVDVLKLDMAFLGKSSNPVKAKMILQSIIAMARGIGILSIAEGVEGKEQLDMLINMGCNMFQGYYFSKPISVSEFEKLIEQ